MESILGTVVAAAEEALVGPIAAVVLEVADLGGVDAVRVVALELAGTAREKGEVRNL